MGDESTKQAAQEYLAAKLAEAGRTFEAQENLEAAIALAPAVWKQFAGTVISKCEEWNGVTQEQTLACKEIALGDLRICCAGNSQQIIVHYDSKKRFVFIKNSAKPEHEPETILQIEGYLSDSGRAAHLVRNDLAINVDMLILAQLRILAGLKSRAEG